MSWQLSENEETKSLANADYDKACSSDVGEWPPYFLRSKLRRDPFILLTMSLWLHRSKHILFFGKKNLDIKRWKFHGQNMTTKSLCITIFDDNKTSCNGYTQTRYTCFSSKLSNVILGKSRCNRTCVVRLHPSFYSTPDIKHGNFNFAYIWPKPFQQIPPEYFLTYFVS